MMVQIDNKVSGEYWDEILKEVIEEKQEPIFTNEIWEKMKDDHGYPDSKESLEIKLFNLQREGYIKSVLRRKKQAWTFPSGEELILLTEIKTIDETIARLFKHTHRLPTLEEMKAEMMNTSGSIADGRILNDRLQQASHLLNDIDHVIKKYLKQSQKNPRNKTMLPPSNEAIFDEMGESIDHFDISIIMLFIETQKKRNAHN
jgi:hypothetical protein